MTYNDGRYSTKPPRIPYLGLWLFVLLVAAVVFFMTGW